MSDLSCSIFGADLLADEPLSSALALDPPLAAAFLIQMLHAFTFAATHMGMVSFVAAAAPPRLASSAMTVLAAIGVGGGTGLAILAAGPLYAAFAAKAYLAMAAMGFVGLALCLWLSTNWRGQRLMD